MRRSISWPGYAHVASLVTRIVWHYQRHGQDITYALVCGFDWETVPPGEPFWREMYDRLELERLEAACA